MKKLKKKNIIIILNQLIYFRMEDFPFGVKVGKKVRPKIKKDKIFELFEIYEESITLKNNYIKELQKEIKNLRLQLANNQRKKNNKVVKTSVDINSKFNKWLKYYNLVKDSAVDLNGDEIKDITSYGRGYMTDIINVREYLKMIFIKIKSKLTLQQFKCNLSNPTWYNSDKFQYRSKLIETLKRLNISLDIFLDSKIVKNYFI